MFYYQQTNNSPCVPCDLEKFLEVTHNDHVRAIIEQVRAAVKAGDIDKANEVKRKLPMFMFMAGDVEAHVYQGQSKMNEGKTGCWRSQAHTILNGLVMLDFDGLKEDASAVFHRDIAPHRDEIGLLLAHVTPKFGLRLVCKADINVGNLADNQKHIADMVGLELDQACKDSSRGSFVCTSDDILYQDNNIFSYQNDEYDKKFGESYRTGGLPKSLRKEGLTYGDRTQASPLGEVGGAPEHPLPSEGDGGRLLFCGLPYSEIQAALWQAYSGRPAVGARHTGVLAMAGRLRYICDNNRDNILAVIDGCGLPQREVEDIVDAVVNKPMAPYIPRKMREVIEGLCVERNLPSPFKTNGSASAQGGAGLEKAVQVDYDYWARRLKPLLCQGLDDAVCTMPDEIKIGGAMAAGAMFGTYLTRCSFLHGDGEQRRLSFLVYIIGLPASGKGFLPDMDKLIMEPMRVADETGRRMEQQYKEDLKKRESSSKNQKDAAQEVPHPVIRYVPSSISNAMLYTRLRDAKETVNGEEMHLHLYTCEAELSAALRAQTGSWAGKLDLECKSFQNEDCGVDYKNSESANGIYQVNWNQVISGTPDALRRKFKIANSLDGLTTRIAIFQMPEHRYQIRELRTQKNRDYDLENRLRTWGYRLDKIHGELICPKLVEAAWQWLKDVSDEAEENDDIITDFFDKRITMYFVRYGLVHYMLRDIAYVEMLQKEGKPLKLRINKSDIEFGRLMADFILMMQVRMFGEQTWNALQNEKKEFVPRKRENKFADLYKNLPETFDTDKLAEVYQVTKGAAVSHIFRLEKRMMIKRIKKGVYKKIVF